MCVFRFDHTWRLHIPNNQSNVLFRSNNILAFLRENCVGETIFWQKIQHMGAPEDPIFVVGCKIEISSKKIFFFQNLYHSLKGEKSICDRKNEHQECGNLVFQSTFLLFYDDECGSFYPKSQLGTFTVYKLTK